MAFLCPQPVAAGDTAPYRASLSTSSARSSRTHAGRRALGGLTCGGLLGLQLAACVCDPDDVGTQETAQWDTCPLAARLYVGRRISEAREDLGLKQGEVAAELPPGLGDRTAVVRVEHGERKPAKTVRAILGVVLDTAEDLPTLYELADAGDQQIYCNEAKYKGMGPRQRQTAELEWAARRIRIYLNALPPGLLQIQSYARHLAEVAIALGEKVNIGGMLRGRQGRQQAFANSKTELDIYVAPQVLDQLNGPPGVAREQLMYLYDAATTDRRISLRVLPSKSQFPAGFQPTAPYEIFEYATAGMTLVDVDNMDMGRLIVDPVVVERYAKLHDMMESRALSRDDSARMLREAAEAAA